MRAILLNKMTLTAVLAVTMAVAAFEHAPSVAAGAALPNDDKAILHVLNRVGFGPRPGDLEKVRAMGLQAYIDQQLHPERIPDSGVAPRLAALQTLGMDFRELAEQFEVPTIQARRQRQQQAGQQPPSDQPQRGNRPQRGNPPQVGQGERGNQPPQDRSQAQAGGPAQPPMMPDPLQQRANLPMTELSEQKMLRAIYSDRQLQEVLTDFWFNHFNVDARKGADRYMLTEYDRDTIRPHVLGKFRDLLEATAKSPAMLFYLDNWQSASPQVDPRQAQRQLFGRGQLGRGRGLNLPLPVQPPNAQNMPRGLNENYGRELMELHTLGVDGGYTQKDVTEVARAFTGWTIQNPRMGGGYRFELRLHDPGEKIVLGHVIKARGGESDGLEVLDILAKHPSTAHFIATKLVRRFVSDTPPPALVDRVAARFRETDGDLREVVRTILTSPEFLSPEAYRAKVKTPFEFVVSAVRVTGAQLPNTLPLVRAMQQLGMPLYMCQPPTGYKDTADAWVNTGALVGRMNFALQLANNSLPGGANPNRGRGPGAQRNAGTFVDGVQTASNQLLETALGDELSDTTRATIAKATTAQQRMALTLGSPEFQRR